MTPRVTSIEPFPARFTIYSPIPVQLQPYEPTATTWGPQPFAYYRKVAFPKQRGIKARNEKVQRSTCLLYTSGKTNPSSRNGKRPIQHARCIDERVSVHDTVTEELGVLQAGNHAEHPLLLTEREVRLEPDKIACGAFRIFRTQICFKVKFLKSLKPQNTASSFLDFGVVQKAKICLDTVDSSITWWVTWWITWWASPSKL